MRRCVCKGRTGHSNVVDSKSGSLMNNDLYIWCCLLRINDKAKPKIETKFTNRI